MALSPTASTTNDRVVDADPIIETSRTYDIFTTGLNGIIDDTAAIRQFIKKALITARSTFMVYGDDYGTDLYDLIGQNVPKALFDTEVTRMITEALIYDERILGVSNFRISQISDAVLIEFNVETVDGSLLTEEVTL